MATRLFGLLCLVLLASAAVLFAEDLQSRVTITGAGGRQTELESVARALLPDGGLLPLSAHSLDQTRQLLEDSRFFSRIQLDLDSTSVPPVLDVHLVAALLISNIKVSGQRPFFEREILDVLSIYPGDVYDSLEVAGQAEGIREFYRRSGRRLNDVRLVTAVDSVDATCTIQIELESDRYVRLGSLEFTGNHAFSGSRLRWKLKTWRHHYLPGEAGRFQEQELQDDLESLRSWYREKGYPEFTVSVTRVARDADGDSPRLDLILAVHEGPLYRVTCDGHHRLGRSRLARSSSLTERGNRADATLRRDLQAMLELYHRKGYPFTTIELDAPRVDDDAHLRTVRYRITEGPRTRISAVDLSGNHQIGNERLLRNVLSRKGRIWDEQLSKEDADALFNLYQNLGYRHATVDLTHELSQDSSRVAIRFVIQEGRPSKLETVLHAAPGAGSIPDSLLQQVIVGDSIWTPGVLDRQERSLLAALARQGHLRASLDQELVLNADSTRARLDVSVNPGPRQTMGKLFFRGNFRTSPRFLARELDLPTGMPFSRQALLKGQQRLQNQPILASARLRTLGMSQLRDTVHVLVELEEKPPWYVEGASGYHSSDGLYLRSRVGNRNLFGKARHLWLGGRASQTLMRAESGLIDPRFLGERLSGAATVYYEKQELLNQNFGARSFGLELGVDKELGSRWRMGASLVREQRQLFGSLARSLTGELDSLLSAAALDPRDRLSLAPSLRFDSRDNFLRPRKGLLGSVNAELSHGLDNRLEDFLRLDTELRAYRSLGDRFIVAGLVRLGQARPVWGANVLSPDRLYFLGGSRSVRGYAENSLYRDASGAALGGPVALSGAWELRTALSHSLELVLFADQGVLAGGWNWADWEQPRTGAGLGLRWQTAIGPVGVVHGWKLARRPGEDAGRFHFSLGYPI
ncbi:MAG: BamA/TamA family outer membrane protein [Candidatus Cloacimonetes bacterium]|nr:BamA/TamA family outer membrane protein [Candidatus Cloacimonadota bacterium]